MFDMKKLENYPKYPIHLSESEGQNLAEIFIEKPLTKGINRKFVYDYNGYRYYLLEEIMVEENIGYTEIKHAHLHIIGKNFFLSREKIENE